MVIGNAFATLACSGEFRWSSKVITTGYPDALKA